MPDEYGAITSDLSVPLPSTAQSPTQEAKPTRLYYTARIIKQQDKKFLEVPAEVYRRADYANSRELVCWLEAISGSERPMRARDEVGTLWISPFAGVDHRYVFYVTVRIQSQAASFAPVLEHLSALGIDVLHCSSVDMGSKAAGEPAELIVSAPERIFSHGTGKDRPACLKEMLVENLGRVKTLCGDAETAIQVSTPDGWSRILETPALGTTPSPKLPSDESGAEPNTMPDVCYLEIPGSSQLPDSSFATLTFYVQSHLLEATLKHPDEMILSLGAALNREGQQLSMLVQALAELYVDLRLIRPLPPERRRWSRLPGDAVLYELVGNVRSSKLRAFDDETIERLITATICKCHRIQPQKAPRVRVLDLQPRSTPPYFSVSVGKVIGNKAPQPPVLVREPSELVVFIPRSGWVAEVTIRPLGEGAGDMVRKNEAFSSLELESEAHTESRVLCEVADHLFGAAVARELESLLGSLSKLPGEIGAGVTPDGSQLGRPVLDSAWAAFDLDILPVLKERVSNKRPLLVWTGTRSELVRPTCSVEQLEEIRTTLKRALWEREWKDGEQLAGELTRAFESLRSCFLQSGSQVPAREIAVGRNRPPDSAQERR